MIIVLASDHAGFEAKEWVKAHLTGHEVRDMGAHALNPADDYPAYMHAAAAEVVNHPDAVGIIFGGSGQGEAIVANRHPGIRAVVYCAADPRVITLGREHNNANVLSVGARFLSKEEVISAVDMFLSTPFPGDERHMRRIQQIDL